MVATAFLVFAADFGICLAAGDILEVSGDIVRVRLGLFAVVNSLSSVFDECRIVLFERSLVREGNLLRY